MAEYAEVKRGKSGAEAETQEVENRVPTRIIIQHNRDKSAWEVREEFEQHKPTTEEFSVEERQDLLDYIDSCLGSDEESEE